MIDNTNPYKKKVWSKPELYILDRGGVNGGGPGANAKEGTAIGGARYNILTNNGAFKFEGAKATWQNYHS